MQLILAFQPELVHTALLRVALDELAKGAEVVIVDSVEAALSVFDRQVPDVVLLHPLMRPADQDYLVAYLRALPHADHVQTIEIPQLHIPCDAPRPTRLSLDALSPARSWLDALKRVPEQRTESLGCDPRSFAADVVGYLTRAREIKEARQWKADNGALAATDRRGEQRRVPVEVPWVLSVQLFQEEQADLVNVSSRGALVRTLTRPNLWSLKHVDLDSRPRPGLTFHLESGAEVHAAGHVVRCHKVTRESGPILYEVAFRFEKSVCLDFLPAVWSLPGGPADRELNGIIAQVPREVRTRRVYEVLDRSATLQDEPFADAVGNGPDVRLVDLADRLALRIRELEALRNAVAESINPPGVSPSVRSRK